MRRTSPLAGCVALLAPTADYLAVKFDDQNATAGTLGDVHDVVSVDHSVVREPDATPFRDVVALGIKHLAAVVLTVLDVGQVVPVCGDVVRKIELAGSVAGGSRDLSEDLALIVDRVALASGKYQFPVRSELVAPVLLIAVRHVDVS